MGRGEGRKGCNYKSITFIMEHFMAISDIFEVQASLMHSFG